ncbi:MAG: hypothetical protein JWL96_3936 [Sphingomonas bacterium]|uniref:hypothetical protein n=1 Tax=Sphingomonas bacterium TaxID=1895847 RepID=UPI00261A622F|nr:hypothetical protein [Sphingomonas bacterium]MDB5711866.1 hypothetical protein [Sphingomonas bacterium]
MNKGIIVRLSTSIVAVYMIGIPATGWAQVTSVSPSSSLPAEGGVCELHVWTSTDYVAQQHGLLEGFGAVGAIVDMAVSKRPARDIGGQMAQYLDVDAEFAELQKVDLATMLKRPGLRIVAEPGVLSWKETKSLSKNSRRRTSSTAQCYAEIIISSVVYSKAALFRGNLYVNIAYRDFTGRTLPTFVLGFGKTALEKFPARADDQADAARAEIRDAFRAAFAAYAMKKLTS